MSVAKKPRPTSKPKAKSAKPNGTDPAAAQKRAAKARAAELKKAKAAEAKAAKAKAAEDKKAKAAELKKAKAAEAKATKAKAAEDRKAKAVELKKAKAAADKEAKARAAQEKKAKAAAERAAKPRPAKRKPARPENPTGPSPEPLTLDSIEKQIREAYLHETHGAVKERVLLKDLRPKIGVQSEDFDQALLAMQQQGKIVLMGLDNPMERTPEVEAAAVHIAGLPRYLVYFQG